MYCSLAGSHTLADKRVSVAYCRPAILHCAIHDIASKCIALHYDPRYAELLRAAGASERVLRLLEPNAEDAERDDDDGGDVRVLAARSSPAAAARLDGGGSATAAAAMPPPARLRPREDNDDLPRPPGEVCWL